MKGVKVKVTRKALEMSIKDETLPAGIELELCSSLVLAVKPRDVRIIFRPKSFGKILSWETLRWLTAFSFSPFSSHGLEDEQR